jgi:hypothetical protein
MHPQWLIAQLSHPDSPRSGKYKGSFSTVHPIYSFFSSLSRSARKRDWIRPHFRSLEAAISARGKGGPPRILI